MFFAVDLLDLKFWKVYMTTASDVRIRLPLDNRRTRLPAGQTKKGRSVLNKPLPLTAFCQWIIYEMSFVLIL